MMKTLLLSIFSLWSFVGIACQCAPPGELSVAQKMETEMSEYIFIGQIIKVSQDLKIVQLETKDVFKGDFKEGQVIVFENNYSCEPFVEKPGEWLIYGKIENGKFRINICGLSRSIKHPETNRYFSIPPPQPALNSSVKNVDRNVKKENFKRKQRQTAIREIEKEISELRNLKK